MSVGAGAGRGEAVAAIVDAIDAVSCSHPVRVAIDGSAAAGKTTLADELAVALRGHGRDVIRASIEGFLRPRIERYRRGPESSRGCYEDSFDYERLLVELLWPLGESGSRLYRTRVYDRRADLPIDSEQMEARVDAILLFDGVFLLRPELVHAWDFRVFLTVASQEIIRRARVRDAEVYGSPDAAEQRFRAGYLPSPAALPPHSPAERARRRRTRERRPVAAGRTRAELKSGGECRLGQRSGMSRDGKVPILVLVE